MHRVLLPLVLLLAVAGCSDDGDGGGGDRGRGGDHPEADLGAACDALGDEEVSALVGVPVTRGDDPSLPGGASCTYYDAADEGLLNVVVVAEDGSFDSLADLAGSDDVETAPLELEGADEALVVDTTTDTLGATSVLASDGDAAYTVYPTGLTRDDELRVGTAVLRLLLGGEPDPADTVDRAQVPHPCDQVTQAEAREALGAAVTASPADSGSVPQCLYESSRLSVSILDLGRITRVDNAASPIGGERGTEVPAPAPLTAYRPASPETAGSQLFVATDRTVLSVQVATDGDGPSAAGAAAQLAEALLPALV